MQINLAECLFCVGSEGDNEVGLRRRDGLGCLIGSRMDSNFDF